MAAIYKRGAVWWGRIQRNGREYRESLKTPSRAVAQKRLQEWIERLDAANWGDTPARTYDEAMLHFLTGHVPTLRTGSQRRYHTSARMLTPHFEGLLLHQIGHGKLSEFEAYRRREGASGPTIRRDLACLSSMFEIVLADWEIDMPNPVTGYLKKRAKRGLREAPPRTRYLSHEEEEALLAAAGEYLRPMIAFAIDSGLRLEEQLSLTREQINLTRGEVTVLAEKSKTGRARTVPLLPRAAQISAQLPISIRVPHYVFHKADGSRYGKLTRGLAGAAKRAGLKDIRWHDLRRTCGCRLLQDHGLSIERVSKWLGHQSIAQTQRAYAFLEVDDLHRAVRAGTKAGTGRAD